MEKKIAFQGELGANSHLACQEACPDYTPLPCATFEDLFSVVEEGKAELGMIPVENSIVGRITDIHHLLPQSSLHIIGEHFLPIHFHLMGVRGANLDSISQVHSQSFALGQCRNFIRRHNLSTEMTADTAGAARLVAHMANPVHGAIAPRMAAKVYDLDIIAEHIEDATHNTTRFVIMSRQAKDIEISEKLIITSFLFQVRNVPAALYKTMGGFATNGVNMTKLESYQLDGSFNATQFYAEIEGHPDQRSIQLAMEELGFFSKSLRVLGVFEAHPYRLNAYANQGLYK